MKRYYMVIAVKDGYSVAMGTNVIDPKRMAEVRMFPTFGKAEQAAKSIALGEFEWHPGEYVSNR